MTGPWDLAAATEDLETGLRELGATKDVILVSHSMAGEIATYLTIKQPTWFKGVVLVDANVPDFFTDEIVTAMNAEYTPMVASLTSAPSTRENRQLLAMAASFDEVSRSFHTAVWPASVPVVVIGSEQTPFGAGPVGDAWRAAHEQFVDGAPNRLHGRRTQRSRHHRHGQPRRDPAGNFRHCRGSVLVCVILRTSG